MSRPWRDDAWRQFIDQLAAIGFTEAYAAAVRGFWGGLVALVPNARVPRAGRTTDGNLQLVWDRDRHHLDVDILDDGALEWFYADRISRTRMSGEGDLRTVIGKLQPYLETFFAS